MQMIFQDPMASLNPRHTIGRILIEPILFHRVAKTTPTRARRWCTAFSIASDCRRGRSTVIPHELSGGQRQRVGIARAVVLRPDFVLADEIVSGLDVSTQAQVLRLLKELTREMHLGARLHQPRSFGRRARSATASLSCATGRVVEEGPCETIFAAPAAAYTRMLIDAIPLPAIDPGWPPAERRWRLPRAAEG